MLIAACVFVFGMIVWLIDKEMYKRSRAKSAHRGVVRMREGNPSENTGDDMYALSSQYSGLPAVPVNPLDYDGWFEEVRKRIRMRSLGLTVVQETTLQNQLNALQGARLVGIQTEAQLQNALSDLAIVKRNTRQRAESADQIQAKQAQLDLLKIDTEIAKTQKELDELKAPKSASQVRENRESREEKFFSEWNRLQEQRKRRLAACASDPKCGEMVNRFFDNEEEKLKEGR
jgi:hypothetical protein